MTSTWTWEAKPIVGMAASAGSRFIVARVPSGSVRALLRSKMTSAGGLLRISTSAASDDRANVTGTPRWLAAVLIFDVNIRSSRIARITL